MDVGGGSKEVILKDRVTVLAQSAECEGDWAIAQFNVVGLLHDAVCVRNGEVGEVAVIFFEAVGALCIWLM